MKPYVKQPITSLEEAHDYLRKLQAEDLLYHPDDDAAFVVAHDGRFLFKPEDVSDLNARMAEVRTFDPDPCRFISTYLA